MRRWHDPRFSQAMMKMARPTAINDGWLAMLLKRVNPEHRLIYFIPPRSKTWRSGLLFARDGDRLLVGTDQAKAKWVERQRVSAR